MKICIISNLYPPFDRGGAEQVVKKSIEALVQKGHKVILITSSPEKTEKLEEKGLTIYRIKPKNFFFYTDAHKHNFFMRVFWHLFDIFHIGVARQVESILKEQKPDVVHTHNLMGLSFLIPSAIRRVGLKHVHTLHDVQLVEPSGLIIKKKEKSFRYNSIFTKLYIFVINKLMGSPEMIISPSKFLLDFYGEKGFFKNSEKKVLRNPLTFQMDSPREKTKNKNLELVFIGQIEEHKGVLFLLDAFEKFLEKNNANLHIIGKGSLLKSIEIRSEGHKNIKVHGFLGRDALKKLLSKMDLSIVPSLCIENSPTVIFESFVLGIPVLAAKQKAFEEIIEDGKNGSFFEMENEEDFIKKLEFFVENRGILDKMGENTSEVLEGLSEEDYIRDLEGVYFS